MKALSKLAVATAALTIAASPAMANGGWWGWWDDTGVTVTGSITKNKDVDVDLNVTKVKNVAIVVGATISVVTDPDTGESSVVFTPVPILPGGAAEADAVTSQITKGNTVDHDMNTNQGEGPVVTETPDGTQWDEPLLLKAKIGGDGAAGEAAIMRNTGIVQFNQDVGNMVNQGNVVAAAVSVADSAFSNAEASGMQKLKWNSSTTIVPFNFDPAGDPGIDKAATILGSINENQGIIQVNQNTGDMNNQLNAASIALADPGAVVALAESDLGQFNIGNSVEDRNTFKLDSVTDSVNNNSGVINVNQSSGGMNNQATMVSFAGLAAIGGTASPATP